MWLSKVRVKLLTLDSKNRDKIKFLVIKKLENKWPPKLYDTRTE